MITKGIVQTKNLENGKYVVYIPYLHKANQDRENAVVEATAVQLKGSEYNYQEGDIVYVGFEEGYFHRPVIIGFFKKGQESELVQLELSNLKSKEAFFEKVEINNINIYNKIIELERRIESLE